MAFFSSSVGSGRVPWSMGSATAGSLIWLRKYLAGSYFLMESMSDCGKDSEPRNWEPGGVESFQVDSLESLARSVIRLV